MSEYRDRNKNYVPDNLHLPAPWSVMVRGKEYPATWGAADELNRDMQGSWEWADVSGNGTHWSHLQSGWHRVQIGCSIQTENSRSVNEWKGRDEIKGAGAYELFFDGVQVYEGWFNDFFEVLLTIRRRAQELLDVPVDGWWKEGGKKLVGRKIFYREVPAVIERVILDQGCVMIVPDNEKSAFPSSAGYDEETDGYDYGAEPEAKVEVYSEKIWWWRK